VEKQIIDGVTGIYVSHEENGVWGKPQRVVLNNDMSLDGCAFVQGSTMWFCSARKGYTGVHWFKAELVDGRWQNWKCADDEFPETYEVGELHITSDGKELYFHSPRTGGKGNYDIWVTKRSDGAWLDLENIQVVNTADSEGWPFITQDGNELWFTRFYMGSPGVFRSKRVHGNWSEPELIISSFAGEPTLDNEGNVYFVHHFYREGQMIEADIYVARKK
jgi:hypothetical protein